MTNIQELENKINELNKTIEIHDSVITNNYNEIINVVKRFNDMTIVKQREERKTKKIRKIRLTEIQQKILKLYNEGYRQKDIAKKISDSMTTGILTRNKCSASNVRQHLKRMHKMGYLMESEQNEV